MKNLQDISINKDKAPIPPLVVMALNLRTLPNPKTRENEVSYIKETGDIRVFCFRLLVEVFHHRYHLKSVVHASTG